MSTKPKIELPIGLSPDVLYTMKDFESFGIRQTALRSARKKGLKVRYAHRKCWIYGQDWINYILGLPDYSGDGTLRSDAKAVQ